MKCRSVPAVLAALCSMAVLIADPGTGILAGKEGITLCAETVVPGMFPFFVLSGLITDQIGASACRSRSPLASLLKIPAGTEPLLLTAVLGGYPVGAGCIARQYARGGLSLKDARRMLGFCCSAGPAFLFGMLGPMFDSPAAAFVLWGITLLSAAFTAVLLPGTPETGASVPSRKPSGGIRASLIATASVCGWILLFRIALAYARKWFLGSLPLLPQVLISGLTELANGCLLLEAISSPALRFLLAGLMTGLGGLCVTLQVRSAAGSALFSGIYIRGKLIQTFWTVLLSIPAAMLLFGHGLFPGLPLLGAVLGAAVLTAGACKNKDSNPARAVV